MRHEDRHINKRRNEAGPHRALHTSFDYAGSGQLDGRGRPGPDKPRWFTSGLILGVLGAIGTALVAATQVSAEQGTSNLGSWARLLRLTSLGVVLSGRSADRWGLYGGFIFLLAAAALAAWRWRTKSGGIESREASPEWLSLSGAVAQYCDPEFVSIRDRYVSTYHQNFTRYQELEAEMHKVSAGGWHDRPEALDKYKGLRDQWERFGAVLTAANRGLRDIWAVLRDELNEYLISGKLIARGFREPHIAGNREVSIQPSEWRILEPNPDASAATKAGDASNIMYSGVEVASTFSMTEQELPSPSSSPLEIVFDPANALRRFWSIEQARDETGNPLPNSSYWEYRVLIRNKSPKTLRNVKVTVEAIGPMPTRPEPSHFDLNKSQSLDLNPHGEALALLRRWFNPPIVVGMVCGGAYGPIKVTASADNVLPTTMFFHFDPEKTPMISEIAW